MNELQQTYDVLSSFVDNQRDTLRSDGESNNYFGAIFGEVLKYYEYLSLIFGRYTVAGKAYLATSLEMQEESAKHGDGNRRMTEEEVQAWNAHRGHQTKLILELESFYLFSNVFLDRVAAATEYYFGPATKPWRSFDSMKKYLLEYAANRTLSTPSNNMVVSIKWLHENVCTFRHIYLAHKHEKDSRVRSLFGIGYGGASEGIYFNLGMMYPKEGETPVLAKKPEEMINRINIFINTWIGYMSDNEVHRRLTPPQD